MRVAITGGRGFLAWHLSCRLRALEGVEPLLLGREEFADEARVAEQLADIDVVYHLAGVNCAASDDEVESGNVEAAEALAGALRDRSVHVVYGNSIQAALDNPYGRGKRRAGEFLGGLPGTCADVRLPNLFGEQGRPAYNSFVATFCHEVANGRAPSVTGDGVVPLLHAQTAAEVLMTAAGRRETHEVSPAGEEREVSGVLDLITRFHELYAERGEFPDLSTVFSRDLFNTFRSYLFPDQFPIHPLEHADTRGSLVETARSHGGTGQTFVSTTVPGAVRGDHYHLRKVERFFVVKGEAEIALRRLMHDDVVTFRVSGDRPGFVDMPTLWVHNICNVGDEDLVTMFWADQLLDPVNPDQYQERVGRPL